MGLGFGKSINETTDAPRILLIDGRFGETSIVPVRDPFGRARAVARMNLANLTCDLLLSGNIRTADAASERFGELD